MKDHANHVPDPVAKHPQRIMGIACGLSVFLALTVFCYWRSGAYTTRVIRERYATGELLARWQEMAFPSWPRFIRRLSGKLDVQLVTWRRHGTYEAFYRSGNRWLHRSYEHGFVEGKETEWHETGVVLTVVEYLHGIPTAWTGWFKDGTLRTQGSVDDTYELEDE